MANLLEKEPNLVVVLNKIDLFPKQLLLPLMALFQERLPQAHLVPISAKTKDGLDILFEVFKKVLPEGEPLYPDDVLTDQTERFLAAERIREKVFLLTNQEVPYSVAVEIQGLKKPRRLDLCAYLGGKGISEGHHHWQTRGKDQNDRYPSNGFTRTFGTRFIWI